MFSQRTGRVALAARLVCLLAASGCATQDVSREPSGGSLDEQIAMPPGTLSDCDRADFDQPPKLISGGLPLYLVGRRLSGLEGSATLKFTVLSDGRIDDIQAESPESRSFRDHSVIALRTWKLEPALKDGAPVTTSCKMRFIYEVK
ncbi:MAG: energy transducer TonB [Betaproteobacteria bacterium]|nr:MAG: energy transducer TonB [Betaproteobacteria bacterium]